jgi:hypothetical protein
VPAGWPIGSIDGHGSTPAQQLSKGSLYLSAKRAHNLAGPGHRPDIVRRLKSLGPNQWLVIEGKRRGGRRRSRRRTAAAHRDLLNAGLAAAQANLVRYSAPDILALIDERDRLAQEQQTLEQLKTEFRAFSEAVLEVVTEPMRPEIWDAFEAKVMEVQGAE